MLRSAQISTAIDGDLKRRFDVQCAMLNKKLKDAVAEALEIWLSKDDGSKGLPKIPAPIGECVYDNERSAEIMRIITEILPDLTAEDSRLLREVVGYIAVNTRNPRRDQASSLNIPHTQAPAEVQGDTPEDRDRERLRPVRPIERESDKIAAHIRKSGNRGRDPKRKPGNAPAPATIHPRKPQSA